MSINESTFLLIVGRLDQTLSPEENAELDQWLSDPNNRQQYDQIIKVWYRVRNSAHMSEANLAKDWELFKESMQPERKPTVQWMWYAASIFVVGLFISYYFINIHSNSVIYKANNESFMVELSDGSELIIGPNSQVEVSRDFAEVDRKLKLSGLAHFKVTPDPDKPFSVEAGQTKTTVLGTEFVLTETDSQVELAVTEGRVSFRQGPDELILERGESAIAGVGLQKMDFDQNATSWITGKIEFVNTPLDRVAAVLQRHYDTEVTVDNSIEVNEYRLTHRMEHLSVEQAMKEIGLLMDVQVRKSQDGYQFTLAD